MILFAKWRLTKIVSGVELATKKKTPKIRMMSRTYTVTEQNCLFKYATKKKNGMEKQAKKNNIII